MSTLLPVVAVAGAIALGAMSPGPSFVMVVRTAVARSRRDGLAAALGMGAGGAIFAALALLGLTAVIAGVAWLYLGLKVLGGAYLLYLGLRIWGGARQPLDLGRAAGEGGAGAGRSFLLGLTTQLSNPKTAIFYASVFAALLPRGAGPETALLLLPVIFALEAGWYAIVALAFSASRPRQAYLRWKAWIDGLAGTVLAALGLKLMADAARV
jgi:threonine/homoserine/homoserine lactone efflux protein